MRGVEQLGNCKYIEVNDSGLVIEQNGVTKTLEVDTVVICAGQESERLLQESLMNAVKSSPPTTLPPKHIFLIGGSLEASELDAKRAIDQGTRYLL